PVQVGDDARHRRSDDGLVEGRQQQGQHDPDGDQDQSAAGHLGGGHTFSSSLFRFKLKFWTSFSRRCRSCFSSASVKPATSSSWARFFSEPISSSLLWPAGLILTRV